MKRIGLFGKFSRPNVEKIIRSRAAGQLSLMIAHPSIFSSSALSNGVSLICLR